MENSPWQRGAFSARVISQKPCRRQTVLACCEDDQYQSGPTSHLLLLQDSLSIPAAAALGRPELHDNQVTEVCLMLPLCLPEDPIRGSPAFWDQPPSRLSLQPLCPWCHTAARGLGTALSAGWYWFAARLLSHLEPQQDAKTSEWEHRLLRFICSLCWTWQVRGRSWCTENNIFSFVLFLFFSPCCLAF